MKINNIRELDNVKFENFIFKIEDDSLLIINAKENYKIHFEINGNKRLKIAESIKKITDLKLKFNKLNKKEVLSYLYSKGLIKIYGV